MQMWLLQLCHTGNRNHLATNTMTEQEAVNLLLDWDHDLEEAKGLANYT